MPGMMKRPMYKKGGKTKSKNPFLICQVMVK